MPDATDFWESRYAESDRIWSGRPNQALLDVAERLPPGRALDLGCGEGADAIWLAGRGWQVTGLDISGTAIARAREAAAALGIPDHRLNWVVADLSTWVGTGSYDLVTSGFLQSPIHLARVDILRRAAGLVAPAGHLLAVSHAEPPPWSNLAHGHEHEHEFLSPAAELAALALPDQDWEVVLAEVRHRAATGPDGQQATLADGLLLLRRRV